MRKIKNSFKLLFFIVGCLFFISESSNAQSILKRRSVMGSGGVSKSVSVNGKSYTLQQCIGQSGITGTSHKKNFTIIQGFIQPYIINKNYSVSPELDVEIKSGSASDIYIISVKDLEIENLDVSIYNIMGQQIYYKKIKNTREFKINLNSNASGCYILNLRANNKQFSTKLIKI